MLQALLGWTDLRPKSVGCFVVHDSYLHVEITACGYTLNEWVMVSLALLYMHKG
jgi:hypothetical protein